MVTKGSISKPFWMQTNLSAAEIESWNWNPKIEPLIWYFAPSNLPRESINCNPVSCNSKSSAFTISWFSADASMFATWPRYLHCIWVGSPPGWTIKLYFNPFPFLPTQNQVDMVVIVLECHLLVSVRSKSRLQIGKIMTGFWFNQHIKLLVMMQKLLK